MIHLDRDALHSWYRRGLVGEDSLVQAPGSSQWVHLAELLGFSPRGAAATSSRATASGPRPVVSVVASRRWLPLVLIAAVLVLLVAAFVWWWLALRDRTRPTTGRPAAVATPPTPLDRAVAAVTSEAPHLSRATAEMLMARSAAGVLDPPEAFRRAYFLAGRGLAGLTPAEGREFGALNAAAYATLSAADRRRLGGYIDRVRDRQATGPQEDAEMSRLMKAAVLKLPGERRARLQALFEKAVAAAIRGGH